MLSLQYDNGGGAGCDFLLMVGFELSVPVVLVCGEQNSERHGNNGSSSPVTITLMNFPLVDTSTEGDLLFSQRIAKSY